ncbi:uncharacterized protein J8A68_004024 [[Candida] subhashii]|uniref:Uncharacterized protein n=1 Tax=[Candida] subhashii TaxID=561895 RepID=A0A8J5UGI8_9ASCO|nr:uncharacterized protein J8A68_004024 [[Candida] subhashii]KAG7662493.1 hypothetical protein J8A68_004024 [[Candida] subhashii]
MKQSKHTHQQSVDENELSMETTKDKLLDSNANIIHILPSCLQELITIDSVYNILIESTNDNDLKNQLIDLKDSIDHSIVEQSIDQNKCLLLTMMFGSSCMKAIDIVFNKQIYCCLSMGIELNDYFNDPLKFTTTQFKITITSRSTVNMEEKLLLKLGYKKLHGRLVPSSDNNTSTNEIIISSKSLGDYNSVDLYNWYCDCDEYQQSYTDDMKPVKINGDSNLIECLLSQSKSIILEPIPICCHILATLIILFNIEKLHDRVFVEYE